MNINLKKQIDLSKKVVYDISKSKGIADDQKAMVKLVLDYSGSMRSLYDNGTVQKVLERIVPLALQFDDNQSLELYLFEDNYTKLGDVTLENLENFINDKVLGKYSYGGTKYAPVIKGITSEYNGENLIGKATSFLGGLFGKKETVKTNKVQLPAYIIFITDGENSDKSEAELAIREASKSGLFFQFVGIGGASFYFLEKLDNLSGRLIDNANFFKMNDMLKATDNELYDKLLNEFPQWLILAKQNNLIL